MSRSMTAVLKPPARGAARAMLPGARRAGSAALGRERFRRVLNRAYETLGPRFAGPVNYFLASATVPTPFVWQVRFGERSILIPVIPGLPRSWSNALVWRWPPSLGMRTVYEWYLLQGDGGSPSMAAEPDRCPPALLLDVGANDGMHTYPFAAHGWTCVAFEPQSTCVAYIEEACRLNGFSSVTTVQRACGGDSSEAVDFFVSSSSWFSSRARHHVERFETPMRTRVGLVTLDEYCLERRLRPTCVKIDVEGFEWSVLSGARQLLGEFRPDLFVEVSSDREMKPNVWELLIGDLDYHCFEVKQVVRRPLRGVSTLEEFLDAGAHADHADFMFVADARLARRCEVALAEPR